MDDVEKLEKQDLDNYVNALENKIEELSQDLNNLQAEKEQLFNEYVSSLQLIYRIGEE
ncbi:hypothetical protein J7J63_03450 [Candidatus Bipolaricaulota bacterium]|nr:hypothetical protein [Candidatus Bipolaricaulota bacterium]